MQRRTSEKRGGKGGGKRPFLRQPTKLGKGRGRKTLKKPWGEMPERAYYSTDDSNVFFADGMKRKGKQSLHDWPATFQTVQCRSSQEGEEVTKKSTLKNGSGGEVRYQATGRLKLLQGGEGSLLKGNFRKSRKKEGLSSE